MAFDVQGDSLDKFADALERAAPYAFVREVAEPALDEIEPRAGRGREVEMEPRVALEPAGDPRVFVRPVVVHDQVQVESGRGLLVDALEETDELLMAVARHAVADDAAVERVQGGEERGRAVARVVVGLPRRDAGTQREQRLRALKRLDLAFLVHAQHERPVGRVEIESDHIAELLDKPSVAAGLERLRHMGLEPVPVPDAPHRGLADPLRLGHGPRAPVGGVRRRCLKRRVHDGGDLARRYLRDASGPGGVFLKPRKAQRQKPLAPQLNGRPGDCQALRDLLVLQAVGRHLNQPRPLHHALRQRARGRPTVQRLRFFGRQYNRLCRFHGQKHGRFLLISKAIYDSLH